MKTSRKVGLIIGLLLILSSSSYAREDRKEILIINSYNSDYKWTYNMVNGFLEEIEKTFPDANVYIEYMDTKNYMSESYYEQLKRIYAFKYANKNIDYIITSDDNAFRFVKENRDELFNQVPIFFAGVNNLEVYALEKELDIFGIEENASFLETLELAIKQNPNRDTIYIIFDDSVSARSTLQRIRKQLEEVSYDKSYVFLNHLSFNEIIEKIKIANPAKSMMIYGFYVFDQTGSFPLDYTTRKLAEASDMPLYGLWSFSMDHGIIGGKIVDAKSQGVRIMELVQAYEKGTLEGRQYFESSELTNRYIFDYQALTKNNIEHSILPKEALVINKPDSFYERYRIQITIIGVVVVLLILYLIVLRYQFSKMVRKYKKSQDKLLENKKAKDMNLIFMGLLHQLNKPFGNVVLVLSNVHHKLNLLKTTTTQWELVDEIDEHFKMLDGNVKYLNELITKFRELVRINNQKKKQKINLLDLIQNIHLEKKLKYPERSFDLKINVDQEYQVYLEREKIKKVFSELVENSIEHGFSGREGNKVWVSIQQFKETLIIKYRDNGRGIMESERLFFPFSTTKYDDNIGLGLYKVKHILKSINGDIQYNNTPKGASFTIKIELKKPPLDK